MFRRLLDATATLRITVNGRDVLVAPGDSVAAALLLAGHTVFRRTLRSDQPRGPFCCMGVCFECLVTIDGQPAQQACLVAVKDGMVVLTAEDGDGR